jgi:ABC-type phosphate/phosphonate transport system substrate-binding protein
MIGRRRIVHGSIAVAFSLALLEAAAPGQQAQAPPSPLKIGLVHSLFREVPPALVQVVTPPFQNFLRDQTGMEGEVQVIDDPQDLGKRLNDNQLQLGVFYGFEFAWAQQKYPDLKPLVVAVNRQHTLRAFVVVRNDNLATELVDIKGKTLSVPRRSREYSLLFLNRELSKLGAEQKDFFAAVTQHSNSEEALDDILRDKVQAALVDALALTSYEQVKPGCFARLKVLKQSEAFPPGVVAYRQGALDNATLARFRDGMLTANQSARGRDLMGLLKLSAFENVPADLDQALGHILKVYPAPEAKAKN